MKYTIPIGSSFRPAQGEFTYLPQVETFEDTDIVDLELQVNTWLQDRIAIPLITYFVLDVRFHVLGSNKFAAVVVYIARTTV